MLDKDVGQEPRVAAVAVRETVDADETMLEPDTDFVPFVGVFMNPESGVVE